MFRAHRGTARAGCVKLGRSHHHYTRCRAYPVQPYGDGGGIRRSRGRSFRVFGLRRFGLWRRSARPRDTIDLRPFRIRRRRAACFTRLVATFRSDRRIWQISPGSAVDCCGPGVCRGVVAHRFFESLPRVAGSHAAWLFDRLAHAAGTKVIDRFRSADYRRRGEKRLAVRSRVRSGVQETFRDTARQLSPIPGCRTSRPII